MASVFSRWRLLPHKDCLRKLSRLIRALSRTFAPIFSLYLILSGSMFNCTGVMPLLWVLWCHLELPYTLRRRHPTEARYTLFANNDEKGTNKRNPCEMRIMCKEWFVRFVSILRKTFSGNAFAGVGGFLTNSKNFFIVFSVSTHFRKNWGLRRIVCRPLFIMLCEM